MPSFRERYCSKHNMVYYDSKYPQCREEEEKQQFEKIVEPLKKAERKREGQKQLRLILTKLEEARPIEQTARYRRCVCPYCGHPSLFFSAVTGYECHNRGCGLTSSVRYYTEQSSG